jgi:hypothetical protein
VHFGTIMWAPGARGVKLTSKRYWLGWLNPRADGEVGHGIRTNDAEELGDSKSTAAAVHTAAAPLEATCANTVES